MAARHRLQQSIYHLLKHNKDGAFETQGARKAILFQAAAELVAGGFKLAHVQGLKQKHIQYLNQHWQKKDLSIGTIKNRNSHLRWLCEKLGKANVVPDNDALGIGRRQYSKNYDNKAVEIQHIDLTKITNPQVLVSIHLQRHLGLRREESIKIKPHLADKGDYLELQASWCKGGRARRVPILTEEARYWVEQSKNLANDKSQSLIPNGKNYKQQRGIYDRQTIAAGIKHRHGLRHAYAQARYRTLTGWECPKCGGPNTKELTAEQKATDRAVRLIISRELGHSREQVTVNYCGK